MIMATKRLYMETTQIAAKVTAGQISSLLADAGASATLLEYENGDISAMSFRLRVKGDEVPFRLPIRTEAIVAILRGRRQRITKNSKLQDQARRIAWRQVYRWVQAQLAFIETGMVTVDEVFLPYLQVAVGQTLYDRIAQSGFKALPAPK